MSVPTNIRTLLSGNVVEWARIEFKETWDADASLKTICAFANDIDNWGGGYIVIGVRRKMGDRSIHCWVCQRRKLTVISRTCSINVN